MASVLTPPSTIPFQHKANRTSLSSILTNPPSKQLYKTSSRIGKRHGNCSVTKAKMAVEGGVIEKQEVDLKDKNGDTSERQRQMRYKSEKRSGIKGIEAVAYYGAVSVQHVGRLCENLERSLHFYQNIPGRPAIFARDPDANALEFTQVDN